jgi:hypothetical protein
MLTPPPHPVEQLREIVHRIRQVPDRVRIFTEPVSDLPRVHRINSVLLTALLDLGLPHRGTGAGRRFDALDLANVGLALKLPCPRRAAMRWWSKSLLASDRNGAVLCTLGLGADCPAPGHTGGCEWTVHPELVAASRPGTFREQRPGSYRFDVRLTSEEWYFGEPFHQLVERVLPLRFHLLPYTMSHDLGFLTGTGLADCRLVTRYLVELGNGLGLPVRPAAGYFVMTPYPTFHAWAEFRAGDRWLAADPLLLNAFAEWGIVDPRRWPPNRSLHGRFLRLGDRHCEALTHRGDPLDFVLTARDERTP